MRSIHSVHDLASAVGKIDVGGHAKQITVFGLTFNLDTIWGSLLAAAIVCGLAWVMTRNGRRQMREGKGTPGVPTKAEYIAEWLVSQVQELTDSAIGPQGRRYVPLAVTLFSFILVCNWMGVIPSGHNPEWLPSPTGDINLPLAMALFVWIWVQGASIKAKGPGGYFKHFGQPYKFLIPLNIIEELVKPITLTFRLFGNVFAGLLMVAVLVALLPYGLFAPFEWGWKLFDMFIGAIQAFIFALLAIIYFGMALDTEGH